MWPLRNKKWRVESCVAALEMCSLWQCFHCAIDRLYLQELVWSSFSDAVYPLGQKKWRENMNLLYLKKKSKTLHGLSKWYSVVLWVIKDQIDWLSDLKIRSLVFAFVLNHDFIKYPVGDLTAKIIHAGDAICKTVWTQEILFCGAPSRVKSLIQWQLS